MVANAHVLSEQANGSGAISASSLRKTGIGLALLAAAGASIAFVGALAASDGGAPDASQIGLWTFGLATAAFGTAKLGIASVLLAIVRRILARWDSVLLVLPELKSRAVSEGTHPAGEFETAYGAVVTSERAPAPLAIHRIADAMWAPMLIMGAMALFGGFLLALIAADTVRSDPTLAGSQHAWVQGLQFLGEGLILSGISFLLGRILGIMRKGGGEVQESLGLPIHTLRMPLTAKVFLGLMMAGLMVEIVQFAGYAIVAGSDAAQIAIASTWLGPLREAGLGLLLAGIVLALATIARVLSFQSARVAQIITHGR